MASPPRRRIVAAPARRPQAELRAVRIIVEEDPTPDASYLNSDGMTAYKNGDFHFVCARAEADVTIRGVEQVLTSGTGVGSIESDAEEYIDQVVEQEWGVLREVLKEVGIPTEQLPLEVDRAWVEWRT